MFGLAHVLSSILAISLLLSTSLANCFPNEAVNEPSRTCPVRTIAGISVVDTPLVRAAQRFAREHSDDFAYNHVMRAWLFGTLIAKHNETLGSTIDPEAHAVAAILHDLGWDRSAGSQLVSPDRRFEVDGAIAARDFIRRHREGKKWDERRLQLVWDAIALHTEPSIALFKEPVVQLVHRGTALDFSGPLAVPGLPEDEYNAVVREFPKVGFKAAVNETIIWLCQTKPATTYGE